MDKKTFARRLADSMAAMPNPVKDTKAYNYKYETLDQVLSIVQPALMKNDLLVTQGVTRSESGVWYLVTTLHDLTDDTSRTIDARPLDFGPDQQKNGSYETYARRYALKTCFGLCGEDDDGARTVRTGTDKGKVEKGPQNGPQPAKNRFARLSELKNQAIELGISEDGMKARIASVCGSDDMRVYSDEQIRQAEKAVEGLIKDKKSLKGGDN